MRPLKDISGGLSLQAVADKYGLPYEDAKAAVEGAISGALSGIFHLDVECQMNGQGCEIYVFRSTGVERLPTEKLKKNILRAIKYSIVSALNMETVTHGYEKFRSLAGGIAGGRIIAVHEERIFVELDTETVNCAPDGLAGVCELSHQPPKERGRYRPGDYMNFHVLSIKTSLNGRVPALKASLSRTSRGLTEGLLRRRLTERLLNTQIHCVKRAAGVFSLVETNTRIPGECIKAVSDELKERIIVHFVQK